MIFKPLCNLLLAVLRRGLWRYSYFMSPGVGVYVVTFQKNAYDVVLTFKYRLRVLITSAGEKIAEFSASVYLL